MKLNKRNIYTILAVTLLYKNQTISRSIVLSNIKIVDGDTVWGVYKGKKIKIRFAEIDTPEMKQEYGWEAKECLQKLIESYKYEIEFKYQENDKFDKYNRSLGWLFHNNININYELVKLGYAWVYDKYVIEKNKKYLHQLQNNAKKNKLGLWKEENILAPWDWRKKKIKD